VLPSGFVAPIVIVIVSGGFQFSAGIFIAFHFYVVTMTIFLSASRALKRAKR